MACILKIVIMVKAGEGTADLRITKPPGRIETRDSAGETLPDQEVPGFPGNFFIKADKAGPNSAYNPLAGVLHGRHMELNIAGQIKTSLACGVDMDTKSDNRQFSADDTSAILTGNVAHASLFPSFSGRTGRSPGSG